MAWLSGWDYRKPLVLTGGASGGQTDFQLSIAVSYEAAMQGDFDDIRFTQNDGTTLIDAWLESKINGTSATVWTEFPTTPANTVEQTYYMYYGNSGAVSNWDIETTSLFGDDFEDNTIDTDKWDTANDVGTWTETGGQLHGYSATQGYIINKTSIPTNLMIKTKIKGSGTNMGIGFLTSATGDPYSTGYMTTLVSTYIRLYRLGSMVDNTSQTFSADTWYNVEIYKYGGDITIKVYDVNMSLINTLEYNDTSPLTNTYFGPRPYAITQDNEFVFLSKYVSGPPTYAFGSEESASVAPTAVFYGPFFGPFRGPI
jgi:hypothetical protein